MALKNYEVKYDDGTSTILQLDSGGDGATLEHYEGLVKQKDSGIASVKPAEPTPINAK